MADNPISYSRFTQMPSNVAVHGYTVEEIRSQRGKPDRNLALSPLATPKRSAQRLFLRPSGSDELRVGQPVEPAIDPFEGATSQVSLMRSCLAKLQGGILTDLQSEIGQGDLAGALANLMQDSLHRVDHMAAYLKNSYQMAQTIQARQVGSRS